jgi:hypothetical protein
MSTGIVPISGTRGPAYTGSSVTFSVVDATNTQQATGNCTEYPAGSGIYIANPTINSAWLPARAFMTIGGVLGVQDIAELPGQSSGGGLTAQQTRDALELAATTGAASIDAQLAGLATALSGGGSGNGPYTVTQLVTDGTNPLQGASVGLAANNATLTAATNSDGIATFALSAYAYGRAATLQGYQFTPDTTATIGASGALPTLVMGAVTIPTPNSPNQFALYGTILDSSGFPESNITLSAYLKTDAGIMGNSYSAGPSVSLSSNSGFVSIVLPIGGITFSLSRSNQQEIVDYTTPTVYSDETTYMAGAQIKYTDGIFYQSLIDGNVGITPGSDGSKWLSLGSSVPFPAGIVGKP